MGSQEMPVGVGAWNKAVGRQNGVKKGSYIGSTQDGIRMEGGCRRYPVVELRMRVGDLIWRRRRIGESLQLAYLLPRTKWSVN